VQNAIAVASAAIASIAVIVTWRVFAHQRRHNHFALALALHRDLTTGEVASARAVIGTLWYGEAHYGPPSAKELFTSYFTVS
jgi:hypothetical protein